MERLTPKEKGQSPQAPEQTPELSLGQMSGKSPEQASEEGERHADRRLRLAFVIAEMRIGGAEKALADLLLRIDSARFEPVLYILRPESYHNGVPSFLPKLREAGIPIRFLNLRNFFSLPQALRRLTRYLIEQRADILHSWMFHANLLGRFAARRAKVPVVISGIRVAEKEHRAHLWADRLTSFLVDDYLCVSQSAADWTIRRGKIPARKVRVIPNAVSLPTPSDEGKAPLPPLPPFFDEEPNVRRILFAGRLTRQKGLDWFLSTIPAWLGDPQAAGWKIGLVGEGSEEANLRRQAAALGPDLARRIHFLGWRPDVPALMAKSDLIILPSRYEGMPNVLLEAAACGRAILSSRVDGVEEILGPLAPAQMFAFGDLPDWLAKLRPLLESESLRQTLGEQNRNRVLTEFSPQTITILYQNFFIATTPIATRKNPKREPKKKPH